MTQTRLRKTTSHLLIAISALILFNLLLPGTLALAHLYISSNLTQLLHLKKNRNQRLPFF